MRVCQPSPPARLHVHLAAILAKIDAIERIGHYRETGRWLKPGEGGEAAAE